MESLSSNKASSLPSSRTKRKKQKICLADYIDFLSSHRQLPLTVNFLNQIISIHGFKKLIKVPKKAVRDAVETLDLMDPSRSTLKSSISSSAWLTEEEIIGDLCRLEWQECCVTSIQALNSSTEQQSIPKAKAKRKRRARVSIAEGADSLSSALVSFQSS
ncbi:uncharacterized protein LOC111292435 [Durio zibethinus]|uniref:Uncharacterized protein LOC111292435 n=1 Tax=Durio zibethinus TaxID=66656 RepID=A0A6P5YJ67_DURZI|nr:uncharacterized protein LOC111292435 [Durio zibethinus]XP_022740565.1 uncharacterized protein LOC111292435 [Durio zibethinus]